MLFDLFEKEFDLPAGMIESCDDESVKGKIVCEKYENTIMLTVKELDATQMIGILVMWFPDRQVNSLIGPQAGGFVNRVWIESAEM